MKVGSIGGGEDGGEGGMIDFKLFEHFDFIQTPSLIFSRLILLQVAMITLLVSTLINFFSSTSKQINLMLLEELNKDVCPIQ